MPWFITIATLCIAAAATIGIVVSILAPVIIEEQP